MTAPSDRISSPVPVEIQNWPNPPAKEPVVKNTVVRNVILTAAFDGLVYQVSDYEPKRVRMAILPLDAAIAISDSVPVANGTSTSDITHKPDGAVLPNGVEAYEFFGPDAFWISSLGTPTRVSIIKEFC